MPPSDDTTLATRARPISSTRVRRFRLEVIEGPDAGRELVIDESMAPRVLLGTSPACELQLTDREVSRRHAALALAGSSLRIVDQGSLNGTFVNGVHALDALLAGGETVRIGATKLRVDAGATETRVSAPPVGSFGRLLGTSEAMRRIFPVLERLAGSSVPVVIEGETGTGKEICAETIHEKSARAGKPFVVFDCTAIAPNLIESALFGHERGSFTGATDAQRGVFQQADGGTLLIDEIGDLDRALQAKLLRAIERSAVLRLGAEKWTEVDVRVIAATRRNLDREVQEGRFRDDLFYRLMVARVELPPLRERKEDIALLANAFWVTGGGQGDIPADLLEEWRDAAWPGNVRELYNAVTRLAALGEMRTEVAPRTIDGHAPTFVDPIERVLGMNLTLSSAREIVLREFERRYVTKITADNDGNVTRAAKAAGVAHRYFQLLRARLDKTPPSE